MSLFLAQSGIEPTRTEVIWGIASIIIWILFLVAILLVANWLLNRLLGKPIRWPHRWASKAPSGS